MSTLGDILYKIRGDASSIRRASAETVVAMGAIGASSVATQANLAAITTGVGSLTAALPALAGAFISVGLGKWLKQSALTAARTQVLGTVMHQVGSQAGYTRQELVGLQTDMQDYGVTTQVARQATARMVQSQLDLKYALDLARGAQDLANVSGWNSSKTLERVIWGIASMRTQTLRMLGLSVSRVEAEKKYRKELMRTSGDLTTNEAKHAFMMAVLVALKPLQGSYIQSMKDVGKQLLSMERYVEESANALGEFFLPAMLAVVMETGRLLKQWYHAPKEFRRIVALVLTATTVFLGLWSVLVIVAKIAPIVGKALLGIISFIPHIRLLMIVIALLTAAWATDFLGLARGVEAFQINVKIALGLIGVTIKEFVQMLGAAMKYAWILFTRPWDTAAIEEAKEAMAWHWKEITDAVLLAGDAMTEAWLEAEKGGKVLAFDLKQVENDLNDAQKKARDEILAYGIRMNIAQVVKLKELRGQELADYVQMLKDEEDELRSRDKSALQNAKAAHREYMGALRARLEGQYDLEQAYAEREVSLGRSTAEQAEQARAAVRRKRLQSELDILRQELDFHNEVIIKQAQEAHISYGEFYAKRAGMLARIQKQEARLVQETANTEARMFELRLMGVKDYVTNYLESMREAHSVAAQQDMTLRDRREITEVEYTKRALNRQLEVAEGQIYAKQEELREYESVEGQKGEAYRGLVHDIGVLNLKKKAIEIKGERDITDAVKSEFRQRMDERMAVASQMALAGASNARIQQLVELELAFSQEREVFTRAVEDKVATKEQYSQWVVAREAQVNKEIDDMYRDQTVINQFYWDERMAQATGFFEGMHLAIEELTIQHQNAAQMSYQIMSDFAHGTRDTLSQVLFDFSRNEVKSWEEYWLDAVQSVSQTLSQMIVRMTTNWLLKQIGFDTAAARTESALTREQAHVGALIGMYYALAAAKMAAKLAGAQSGGFVEGGGTKLSMPKGGLGVGKAAGGHIPGYGGGDIRAIRVEPGEYVARKESVRYYGRGFFDGLNKMGSARPSAMVRHRAQYGGMVAASDQSGALAGHTTLVLVTDKEDLAGYFDSNEYGKVVVKRMGPELIKRMGGEE